MPIYGRGLLELAIEERGAREVAELLMTSDGAFQVVGRGVTKKSVALLKSTQIRLVPKYEHNVNRAIRGVTESPDRQTIIGRAGPGVVPGEMPGYGAVTEAGRGAGARVQPFGVNSKLYQWVQFRTGGGIQDARFIAMAISRRGLPSKNNPRTPNPAPVFVERSWMQEGERISSWFYGVGGDMVALMMERYHGPI